MRVCQCRNLKVVEKPGHSNRISFNVSLTGIDIVKSILGVRLNPESVVKPGNGVDAGHWGLRSLSLSYDHLCLVMQRSFPLRVTPTHLELSTHTFPG